ncbi:hypothetical protein IE53DRAFT_318639 [Violaceomyces palustris]|uniref:Uncharacterized protein n=1 Tax=Violaceomyces palustris TaxID=1673888 RepID=A0ACD0NSM8_9BASI|nr:hypothetical protein IE53DRAFT_318639 [Violaceomyces palustris]
MSLFKTLQSLFGISAFPGSPFSPAEVYTLCLLTFKTWPLLMPVVSFVNAPHGRFSIDHLLNVNGNLGWFLMEVPSPILFILSVASPPLSISPTSTTFPPLSTLVNPSLSTFLSLPSPNQVLAALYVIHYLHRAVLSPLRSPKRSPMHISVPLSAILFNVINGFLMGSWIGGRTPWSALPPSSLTVALAASNLSSKKSSALGMKAGGLLGWLGGKLSQSEGRLAKLAATAVPPPLATGSLSLPGPGMIDPQRAWSSPLWYLGLAGWALGFAGNVYHDEILMDLRRKPVTVKQSSSASKRAEGEASLTEEVSVGQGTQARKYAIPRGGLYKSISYPNYFCEWIEWFSYSLAALHLLPIFPPSASLFSDPTTLVQSLRSNLSVMLSTPAFLFPLVEVCVMLPRAVNGHRWYIETFADRYPKERKAVLPGLL